MKMEVGLASHPPPLIHPTLPSPHCPISLGTLPQRSGPRPHPEAVSFCPVGSLASHGHSPQVSLHHSTCSLLPLTSLLRLNPPSCVLPLPLFQASLF